VLDRIEYGIILNRQPENPMRIPKRLSTFSHKDLRALQSAILAEIQRRKDLSEPANSADGPVISLPMAQPAAEPAPEPIVAGPAGSTRVKRRPRRRRAA
jgi:hypothetical protein